MFIGRGKVQTENHKEFGLQQAARGDRLWDGGRPGQLPGAGPGGVGPSSEAVGNRAADRRGTDLYSGGVRQDQVRRATHQTVAFGRGMLYDLRG